jgi:hypothetical protein
MVQVGASVDSVVIYTDGRMSRPGSVSLYEIALTDVICLTTADAVGRCPLDLSGFALNPLTNPYVDDNGYVMFDLAYYAELTYMDKPPRVCFHDPAQELGVSLNFPDQQSFDAFVETMRRNLTVGQPGLPGFYKIYRFTPPFPGSYEFEVKTAKLKDAFLSSPSVADGSPAIERLLPFVQPPDAAVMRPPDSAALDAALQTKDALAAHLRTHLVDPSRTAQVWSALIGIGDLGSINS